MQLKIKSHKGFTLLELLLAMAIMGILATLVIPPLTTLYRDKQELSAATQMMLVFKNARKEAINKRINVRIIFNDALKLIQVVTAADGQVLNQQSLTPKFQSYIMGIKKQTGNTVVASTNNAFGYNTAGVLYRVNGSTVEPITTQENFIFAISMLHKELDIKNEDTKGFLINGDGLTFLCQNKIDKQIQNKCAS
jgi:prepilin-type N-terminal cleavage/methylation domain-containing protein